MSNSTPQETSSSQWTHLLSLPMPRPLPSRTTSGMSPLPQLTPSDKTGTTLRLLLQDAQKTMEKFSERLDKLFATLEQSKQSIHRVEQLYEESRERTADETRATVHVAKAELETKLEMLSTREHINEATSIQSTFIKSLHETMETMDRRMETRLAAIDSKLELLDKKFDQHTICTERNSEALTQTNNQLAQLLAALGAVATLTPLFQVLHALPQHQQDPVTKVSRAVESAQSNSAIYIGSAQEKRKKRSADSIENEAETLPDNKRSKFLLDGLARSGYCEPETATRDSFAETGPSDATLIPSSSCSVNPPDSPCRVPSSAKRTGPRSADLNMLLADDSPIPVQAEKTTSRRGAPRNIKIDVVHGCVTRNTKLGSSSPDENSGTVKPTRPARKTAVRRPKLSAEIGVSEEIIAGSEIDRPEEQEGHGETDSVEKEVDQGEGGDGQRLSVADSSCSKTGPIQHGSGEAVCESTSFKALRESVEEIGSGDWSDPYDVLSTFSDGLPHDSESESDL